MKKFCEIIYKIIRNFIRFIVDTIVSIICWIIFFVTYEPHKFKKVTKRKICRIRRIYKFKIFVFKHLPRTLKFLRYYNSLEEVNKRYGM